MVFSSIIFMFLFLPVVILLYFLVGKKWRNLLLLAASLLFYAWGENRYILVMLASILVNWLLGLALDRTDDVKKRKLLISVAVTANVGTLIYFKYSGFIVENLNVLLNRVGAPTLPVIEQYLPLGISFFTFHALSYVIDIYRRVVRAQRKLIDFALYIAFFPQLIAGPIVRYHDVYKQLRERFTNAARATSGMERFVAGFGKKMLIANPLGAVADTAFGVPTADLSTSTAWIGLICYSLQIYFDFSAYSDMAIGLARLFGFDFLENFNYPYRSRSIQEFWRRWHISLTNWFRDYLYIPLGGNRGTPYQTYRNLLTVFLICGIWHGANWTFVIWGLIHGSFLILERTAFGDLLRRLPMILRYTYTIFIVMMAWVLFRANSLDQAAHYFAHLFGAEASGLLQIDEIFNRRDLFAMLIAIPVALGVGSHVTSDWRSRRGQIGGVVHPPVDAIPIGADGTWALGVRFLLLIGIYLLSCAELAAGTYNPFIYFKF